MNLPLRSTLFLLASSALLPAATYFTEDFSDNSAGPNMVLGTGHGSPTTTTTGSFTITSGTGSRIYLGTNDTDYSTVDFVFQATVTIPNGGAWSIAFLGMGSPNADGAAFGEPLVGSNLFMFAEPGVNRVGSRDNGVGLNDDTSVGTVAGGPHLMRMTWDAGAQQATYEFDNGNDGSFEASFTKNGLDNGFTGSNSQLVLGGGNGVSFDNISVTVPEPSVALLGGLGLIGLLRRRR